MTTHQVKLVHITPNAEELIAYMARVSNPANQNNTETSQRLIRYLIEHKHWSPFEMVNMCVEINTTRSIAAQILRHRSFSFQEFSQRYSDISSIGTPAIPALRRQDTKNRQNSIDDIAEDKKKFFDAKISHLYSECYRVYQDLLDAGVAKECAREVLPLATPTRLYMNGTIRSWIHYCQLRCANGTQLEHRMIANGAYKLLQEHLPNVCLALNNV
jgi:thymidylate synthase (FAD)